MKTRQVVIVACGLLLLIGSVFLMQFLGSQKEEPEKEIPVIPVKAVKTEKVEYSSIPTLTTAYGRVISAEAIDIIAEKSGQILRGNTLLKAGRSFNKGELLFALEDTEVRLNLQSSKSNFLKDLASILPDLKIDFPDSYEKWNSYFKSVEIDKELPNLPNYDDPKEKTFLATQNILSSYYNIKSTEAGLRKYRVYAPFKGTITDVYLQSGSFVNPGGRVIRIIRTDRIEMRVSVEVDDIQWIKKGGKVDVYSQNGEEYWTGTVSRIGDFVNQTTQSIDVFVAINSLGKTIYDGQYLKAELKGKEIEEGAILPREAVFEGNKVYVLADTVLKVREIDIRKTNENTVVYNGLKQGTELVVEPLINAYNNMPAKKLESSLVKENDSLSNATDVRAVTNSN
ncbi:MAG: efflux RND transporter periplasmic adaptor subunit [Bacteroidota bacterium]